MLTPVSMNQAEELLRGSGLLFAINALVLHPYGMALAFCYADDGGPNDPPTSVGLMKTKDGDSLQYDPELLKECQDKLRLFLSIPGSEKSNRDLLESLLRRTGP